MCVCGVHRDLHVWRLICVYEGEWGVSASLRLQGCVLEHRHLMCRIVPQVKQDVCHLSPESAVDTVNLVMSPLTIISGAQGYKEGTYRLISHFNINFKLVTPPTFLVWPMAQDWTHFSKVLWRSKKLGCIRRIWTSLTYMRVKIWVCTVGCRVTLRSILVNFTLREHKSDIKCATVIWKRSTGRENA